MYFRKIASSMVCCYYISFQSKLVMAILYSWKGLQKNNFVEIDFANCTIYFVTKLS